MMKPIFLTLIFFMFSNVNAQPWTPAQQAAIDSANQRLAGGQDIQNTSSRINEIRNQCTRQSSFDDCYLLRVYSDVLQEWEDVTIFFGFGLNREICIAVRDFLLRRDDRPRNYTCARMNR